MGEFDVINEYFAPLSHGASGAYDLKNDAAVLDVAVGNQMVITSDCLIADVHFLKDDPPQTVARKALAVNLSDLAAMGARPRAYTLAIAWPTPIDTHWIKTFASGLKMAQDEWGVTLIGGDTVATAGPLTLTVTAFGEIEAGRALTRSGANPGDDLYVTGTIGDAALGLLVARDDCFTSLDQCHREFLIERYRCPTPRISLGPELLGLATSAIDISDGLIADAKHIADQSAGLAIIAASRVPLSPPVNTLITDTPNILKTVMGGGDDYEILFTAPPSKGPMIDTLADKLSLSITCIGRINGMINAPGVQVIGPDGDPLASDSQFGFLHF